MTYTIVQPIENTNTSYKDTGRLTFYKYEDIQVLAELFAQTNACLACDALNDARGGMAQDGTHTTVWPYLGLAGWWSSYLAPEKRYLDWERVQYLTNGNYSIPWGSTMNDAWLYVSSNPFANYSPYMHQDDRLSAAGTTAGTYALFGNGDVNMKTQDFASTIGLNIPFTFKPWTDPRDIISAYQDAKQLSEYDFNVLTWNKNMTRNWALGQAFDQTFVYSDIERQRQDHTKDYRGHEDWPTPATVERGWSNTAFSIREYWNKYAYYDDYYHPDQYIYEWTSEVDSLVFQGSHPVIERNVPVPTNAFATNCLQGRKVMFVWEAEVVDNITYSDTGIQPAITTRHWYSFIADLTNYGTTDFTDYLGNARGLCLKYTFPTTGFAVQHTSIKNLLNWSIPTFDQSWTRETTHYITSQTKELNIYLRGCYSLQTSYLTEILTRP